MANASIPTLLSLDQYASILGLDPRHFNQVLCAAYPERASCKSVWFQYNWQSKERASRENLAQAISQAERMIAERAGFWPAPEFFTDERHDYPKKRVYPSPYPTKRWPTVAASWGHIVGIGHRYVELLDASAAVVLSDVDGDGFEERATVTVTVPDATGFLPSEIAVFATANSSPENQIRFLHTSIVGNTITIYGESAQFIDPTLWVANPSSLDDDGDRAIDGDDAANYLTEVYVYRIRAYSRGTAYPPAELLWQTIDDAEDMTSQAAALQVYNEKLGIFSVIPAAWNATTSKWDVSWPTCCAHPHQVSFNYLAGWATDAMGNMRMPFSRAVAALATALLTDPICACSNAEQLSLYWQGQDEDQSEIRELCPFGSRRGAWEAWMLVNTFFLELSGMSV